MYNKINNNTMNIETISLDRLKNHDHFQLNTEFRLLVTMHGAKKMKIEAEFKAYETLYALEDLAIKSPAKSVLTPEIREADQIRDQTYTGIYETVKTSLKHFKQANRDAGKRLKVVFDAYGSIRRMSLTQQTSAMYNLLQDLKGKYAGDVALLGLTEWVRELDTRNQEFSALMRERYDESSAKPDVTMREVRPQVDEAYKKIVNVINARVLLEGAGNYEDFIRSLNAIITKYKIALKTSAGRRKKVEEQTAEETQE